VLFTTANRCINSCTASDYPDTPVDQFCSSTTSCPNLVVPAFYTKAKLATITTQVYNQATSGYRNVDKWDMSYTFPSTGDNILPAGTDTAPSLWLRTLTHTGYAADGVTSQAEPTVSFGGTAMNNRSTGATRSVWRPTTTTG
jgi:hypothetical protein